MPKEDGVHNYHFGQMPEMPWKKKDFMFSIRVNDDLNYKEINQRALNVLLEKGNDEFDGLCCDAKLDGFGCTRKKNHVGPHIASCINEIGAVWLDKYSNRVDHESME